MFKKITLILLLFFSLYFRTHQLEGKLTFEWDQSRDYDVIRKMSETHQIPLLGPIVKGEEGGFYLGPMYYYLITPVYYLSHGNPLALAVISIGFDLLVVMLLIRLFSVSLGKYGTFLAALLWACSPLIINNAYTAWNVSLIPTWTLLFLYYHLKINAYSRFTNLLWYIFLSTLTCNIHLTLVPVAAIFFIINIRHFFGHGFKRYFQILLAATMPVSTLILYDLNHHFENLHLIKQFLTINSEKTTNALDVVGVVVEKFGYTISRLFVGEPIIILGWGILILTTLISLSQKKSRLFVQSMILIILVTLFSLILYRDPNFAEYYFNITLIPTALIFGIALNSLIHRLPNIVSIIVVLILSLSLGSVGFKARSNPVSPYSLLVKKQLVAEIISLGYPVEFRTKLPRERNTGFEYLFRQAGLSSDPHATRKAYIYETKNLEIIAPEEARSIIYEKPIAALKLIVFSN